MDSPAGFAEDEVGHTLDKRNTVRELLLTFPAGYDRIFHMFES